MKNKWNSTIPHACSLFTVHCCVCQFLRFVNTDFIDGLFFFCSMFDAKKQEYGEYSLIQRYQFTHCHVDNIYKKRQCSIATSRKLMRHHISTSGSNALEIGNETDEMKGSRYHELQTGGKMNMHARSGVYSAMQGGE